jgi:hypothetical protein
MTLHFSYQPQYQCEVNGQNNVARCYIRRVYQIVTGDKFNVAVRAACLLPTTSVHSDLRTTLKVILDK